MINYKVIVNNSETSAGYSYVEMTDADGVISFVPMDEANSDYQEYLKWKAEQEG